ncbi:MAG: sulfoxide reductase heme-binding subunit YedZ [Proteobacteria bacterium]|nr:sulfoxide reductase heme-binding subunit YedZ [Pseudomonadota bacterium]
MELFDPGSVLGADPGEAVVHFLGTWGIRMLLLSLMVSSVRRLTGKAHIIRYRRMIGLFAFAYLCSHFLAYLGFLVQFDWSLFLEDFTERPYITAGLAALLMLIPLALTSTTGWQRRLRRNWQKLHRLVYGAALLGLLHAIWQTREGFGEVVLYSVVLAFLLGERIWYTLSLRRTG